MSIPRIKSHGSYVELYDPPHTQLYKNMKIVGTLPGATLKDGLLYNRRQSSHSKLYGVVPFQELSQLCGEEFYVVNTTKSNYYETVRSWDNKPTYNYVHSPEHQFALVFFEKYYGGIMNDCIASSEEICSFIDWTKSPGWPHTYYGFRTKAELVAALSDTLFFDRVETLPIWNVSGKTEFKKKSEIDALKIRLFQIPSFELLYSQLKFGKRISLRMLGKHWSAYGFNPYGGGFDGLARKLLSKHWRGCYDVSGWDKFLSLLDEIYVILGKNGEIPPEELEEFLWMAENTCNFLLKTIDGNVLRKTYGNASGSGTTTRDNIFGHIIIFAAGLYSAYFKKHGLAPSFSQVFDQLVYLYGDDNIFSLDDDFSLLCDEKFLGEHLSKYGLKLKFFFGGYDADLEILSFLGAGFKKINGVWYPVYDIKRLATSMIYERDKMSLAQHLSKAFTLMMMSRPSDEFPSFYRAYTNLVNSEIVQSNREDPTVKRFAFVGVPEVHEIDAFFTGQESSRLRDLVPFSPDFLELY